MPSRGWLLAAILSMLSVGVSVGLAAFLTRPAPAPAPLATVPPGPDRETIGAEARRLEAQLRRAPEVAEDWKALGRAYAGLGRYMDAVGAYLEAEKLNPRDPEVRAALGQLSEIARRSGRHEDAIQGR
ncbi:MAG: tetratricopeptide repeat protein [Alphaproteobacteria bacterium]|nr:tetratricopeptide repeat protein [Alphaproteobacteria bacterium]